MKANQENSNKELTVDQLTIAKRIVEEMPEFSLADVQRIIQREQELTMIAVKKGVKVVKKNYLTIYANDTKERKIKRLKIVLQKKKLSLLHHQNLKLLILEEVLFYVWIVLVEDILDHHLMPLLKHKMLLIKS